MYGRLDVGRGFPNVLCKMEHVSKRTSQDLMSHRQKVCRQQAVHLCLLLRGNNMV